MSVLVELVHVNTCHTVAEVSFQSMKTSVMLHTSEVMLAYYLQRGLAVTTPLSPKSSTA